MARHHDSHPQVVTAFVRIPKALGEGQERCAACSAPVTLTPNGTLRRHKMPGGEDCAHHAGHRVVELDEVPPVKMPRSSGRPPTWQKRRSLPKPLRPPSRIETGGDCETCGKWVSGERRFCGQCLRKRDINAPQTSPRPRGEARDG